MVPHSSVGAARRAVHLRRLLFEPLEHRHLLSLAPADIQPQEAQALQDGLAGLSAWLDSLDDYQLAARTLPVVGQSLGRTLDAGAALRQGLAQPVADYFAGDPTPTTSELVDVLRALSGSVPNLAVTVDPASVSGGLDSAAQELVFSLSFQAQRTLASGVSLGPSGDALGIAFDPVVAVTLDVGMTFAFSFGFDLGSGLTPEQAFFIRPSHLAETATASGSGLSGAMNVGFYDAQLTSGTMSLGADLVTTILNFDADAAGRITLEELRQTSMGSLVTQTPAGTASASLSLSAGSFGGFTPGSPLSVSFNSTAPFDPARLSFSPAMDELLNFSNVSSYAVLGILGQLGDWLDGLGRSALLDVRLPLVDASLGHELRLGALFLEPTTGLSARLSDAQGQPTFDSAQGLAGQLETVLGLPPATIAAAYNESTNELSYHLVLSQTLTNDDAPFSFSGDLSPLAGLESSSPVDVTRTASADFTLGLDLSPLQAVLRATADGPALGRLSGDAQFFLKIGAADPVSVLVPQAATAGNGSLADLVSDINTALDSAGLDGVVTAGLDGARVTLSTGGLGVIALVGLSAAVGDPILTEVHFQNGQRAADAINRHVFLQGASFGGTVWLDAPDVDATGELGYLAVSITNGGGDAQVTATLPLADPATQTVGGRVWMGELFAGLVQDLDHVIPGPSIAGTASLTLPLAVTPNVLGAAHPANPALLAAWSDATNPATLAVSFQDAALLLDFAHVEGSTFASAFSGLADFLASLENFSLLAQRIPGLDRSFGRVADYAAHFRELVTRLETDPPRVLQELEGAIEIAFGLAPADLQLWVDADNRILGLDLSLDEAASFPLPLNVDLDGLGLGNFGNLLEAGGTGQLDVNVGVSFDLDFGIDLSDPGTPRPFLYDTTGLEFTLSASGSDIAFTTAIGPLGVWVAGASVLVDADGNAGTADAAQLAVGLTDDNADGKIYLSELALSHVDPPPALTGQVHALLPVYFPTQSSLLGTINLAVADLGNIGASTQLTGLSAQDFEDLFQNFDLLSNLGGIVSGINYVLIGLEDVLRAEVFSHAFPMIGDSLVDAADFIQRVRTDVVEEIEARFTHSARNTPELVQIALFNALGPDGLNLLYDKNSSGTITPNDIFVACIDNDSDGQSDDVAVSFALDKGLTLVDVPIDFDIGLPALGLAVEGDVELKLGFHWEVALGISRRDGFYFDTSLPDELVVSLEARTPDLRSRGNLVFLQLDVTDEDADSNPGNSGVDVDADGVFPSSFIAAITVDLKDPVIDVESPDRLTFAELTGSWDVADLIDVAIVGGADVNLNLVVSYRGDPRFPSISADFALDWTFQATDTGLSGGVPYVAFNDVRLNVGDFISDFSDSLLRKVQQFTEPLQPVVEFLTSPIPILEDFNITATPLDFAEIFGYAEAADYIKAVADVVSLINSVPALPGNVYVPLGSFDLSGDSPTDPRQEEDLTEVDPHVEPNGPDPVAELNIVSPAGGGFFQDMNDAGISLPILEQPMNIFRLLLGQDVDLFLWDLPDLKVGFPFPVMKIGPLIPPIPIFASVSGYIGAGIDLKFGYDTRGFHIFEETHDPLDLFCGLFLSDRENADGTGRDVPEATLTGRISLGLELGIVVASAGLSGGVEINLLANLHDPNNDGKVHVDEFLGNLEHGLLTTFDVSGEIKARLDAYVEILFVRYELKLAEATIADFELTEADIYQDRFAGPSPAPGINVALTFPPAARDLGVAPGLHVDGLSVEAIPGEDWYRFELLRPDSIDVDVRHSFVRGNLDLEVYDSLGVKLGESSTDHDREIVSLVDVPAGYYYARVIGADHKNNYMLAVEPGAASTTRVIYVNPRDKTDRSDSYYTTEPGDDKHDGLLYRKPKASLQSVLDTYDLGPNDLVVLDTGAHALGALITEEDEGATYVGTPAGSKIAGILLDDSDNSLFYRLVLEGEIAGISLPGDGVDDAAGNLIRACTLGDTPLGIFIASREPNLVEANRSAGTGGVGIFLASQTTSTVRNNDVFGRTIGIYSDSVLAEVYDNAIHLCAVGMSSRRGALGPDNPAPFGSPARMAPNTIYDCGTGVLVPADAAGVVVRFTVIESNDVGIQQWGDRTEILANEIRYNGTGICGTGAIGPAEWGAQMYNFVHDNGTGIWGLPGAEIRYNRVYANVTGIKLESDNLAHHNVIYENTQSGVLVDAAHNVEVVNNTISANASGDGIRLENSVAGVLLHNNIVATCSGYALYVAADCQFGYTSDYNNLYTGGNGKIAFQSKDFTDLYDWQVEAESDLHSIGSTRINPTLDAPLFVGGTDFRLQAGSTSIDAGDPNTDFSLEPGPSGGRVNLGAFGNTPLAAASASAWLKITAPNFYVDLVPSWTYAIAWDTFNVPGAVNLAVDLVEEGSGNVTPITTVAVSAGSTTWTPGNFVAGSPTARYRIELRTLGEPALTVRSREPFAVPNLLPGNANTFYVNDSSLIADQYATAAGDNRNTGTTAGDPKAVIRPLVLSYEFGAGDVVYVDTGDYVHAVNLNLAGMAIAFDPRMHRVTGTQILGPTAAQARIDRVNQNSGAKVFDLIASPGMTMQDLVIVGAETGVDVRQGSTDYIACRLEIYGHGRDGLDIESASHGATLDNLAVHDNGRHGIFVDSRLVHLEASSAYRNGAIGVDVVSTGAPQAVIGDSDLTAQRGNLVYENGEDGISASGNVLVAGNTVAKNGNVGIRLAAGADALRNVVRQHTTGISALLSTSQIRENRSYQNSGTGIEASFASLIQENVTYSNDVYGIHVTWFDGRIDHNLIYDTGDTSMVIEGAASGAVVENNTIYEPCAGNTFEPPPGTTTIEIPWRWEIDLTEFDPLWVFPLRLEGTAQIVFHAPLGLGDGGTFSLGPGGGLGALIPEAVPPGQEWQIETEIVALELADDGSTELGPVLVGLSPSQHCYGSIIVQNMEGVLVGNSTFWLNVQFALPNQEKTLIQNMPLEVGATFDFSGGLGAREVFQMAIPLAPRGAPAPLRVDGDPPLPGWGLWQMGAGQAGRAPQHPGLRCAKTGILVTTQSAYVLLRNNIVYVEGCSAVPPLHISHDIVVTADSTTGWQSDFNLLTTRYGRIGQWAGAEQMTLSQWQAASADDDFSIDPDPDRIWVDPDGADDFLGFDTVGANDGRDDNLHLRSPFGQANGGALAPAEDLARGTFPALPSTLAWSFLIDPTLNLSPAVDWGDPAYSYATEPVENGKFLNLGAYGNTPQASASEPEYIHLVYPLGLEELVIGRTYQIVWRSHDTADKVIIELRHVDENGYLELAIDPAAGNTGTYAWTVPAGVSTASDYVVVLKRPSHLAPGDVIGVSRLPFAIGPDTTAPRIDHAAPSIVGWQLSTSADVSSMSLHFSENLDATGALSGASYELRGAGLDATLDTLDDVIWTLAPSYQAAAWDGLPSTVVLGWSAPLTEDYYRLTVWSAAITDVTPLNLDGDGDGAAGGDYVRYFIIDKTAPTADITDVSPDPLNSPLDEITIVFSEAVRGLGLADLCLSRGGGPNLLTGVQTLWTSDLVSWTLGNLAGVTGVDGAYTLTLDPSRGAIRDLAGNPLAVGADDDWIIDMTAPTLKIIPVSPDPRGASLAQILLVFSEPVAGLQLGDLTLTCGGGGNLLTGSPTLGTVDGITWTLDSLSAKTASDGIYVLTVSALSAVHDGAGNQLLADVLEVFEVDLTHPLADLLDVAPDPRNTTVDEISIVFTEPVEGFDLGDLQLTLGGGGNPFNGSQWLTTRDRVHWTLGGLAAITAAPGEYLLQLGTGSGIADRAGNPLAATATVSWRMDLSAPQVTITPVSPDPHASSVDAIAIVFDEPVTGLGLSGLTLTRDGGPNLLDAGATLSTADGVTWTLGNLGRLTAASGHYSLTLMALGSAICDLAGNSPASGAVESWLADTTRPNVDFADVSPDPRVGAIAEAQIVFTEPVSGLEVSDLSLTRNGGGNLLTGSESLTTTDGMTWLLGGLAGLTAADGRYVLTLVANGSGVEDSVGNPLAGGLTTTWIVDLVGAPSLDADGNTAAAPLSDGILIVRYLFDPAGPWSIADVLGTGATRITRPAIKGFLDGAASVLDVDGNGSIDALSDGILILRYLFDPNQAWNVADALGPGATRVTWASIKAYLDQFNPGAFPAPVPAADLVAAVAPAIARDSLVRDDASGDDSAPASEDVTWVAMPDREDSPPTGVRASDVVFEQWVLKAPGDAADVAEEDDEPSSVLAQGVG